MTEAEWLACTDPQRMLEFLGVGASERKLRLFACACCRRVWPLLWGGRNAHDAVVAAEQYADGEETMEVLARSSEIVRSSLELYPNEPVYDPSYWACGSSIREAVFKCASYAANNSTLPFETETDSFCEDKRLQEEAAQAHLFRDIFGNPVRPTTLDASWRTAAVAALAQGVYIDRAFDHLPILADALEDAGCTDQDILNHCREAGVHARGCWPLDLILGRE